MRVGERPVGHSLYDLHTGRVMLLGPTNDLLAILQNDEQFGLIAVSLGYYDTLMSCSGSSTSSEIPADEQREIGISPGLLRLSMGYTGSLESRLAQIEQAVRRVGLA